MSQPPIYLDYNATTPIDRRVAEAMLPFLYEHFGNPSSTHCFGTHSKKAVEQARARVAQLLGCFPDEVVFTGCGSESDSLAIVGLAEASFDRDHRRNHVITCRVEHVAVLEAVSYLQSKAGSPFQATVVGVDRDGIVSVDDIVRAVRPGETCLVTIMHSNNETGALMPVGEIARAVKAIDPGILVHTDAAQSVGKVRLDMSLDLAAVDAMTVVGHKMYAPKGVAALCIRRAAAPLLRGSRIIHGARSQEFGMRAGTENTPHIVALGTAAWICLQEQEEDAVRMSDLRDTFETRLRSALQPLSVAVLVNGPAADRRLPNTLNISLVGVDSHTVLAELADSLALSAGAACHSAPASAGEGRDGAAAVVVTPSHVLAAMGCDVQRARGAIRISTGRMTTPAEIERAVSLLSLVVSKVATTTATIVPAHPSGWEMTESVAAAGAAGAAAGAASGPGVGHRNSNGGMRPVEAVISLQNEGKGEGEDATVGEVKLTRSTKGLGCGCKLRPQLLEQVLKAIPMTRSDPNVLVGISTSDDAGVYRLTDSLALVATLDFFTPVVDDPYAYGQIAAANALSDVYAMGGVPLIALSIVAFPSDRLPMSALQQILKGAQQVVEQEAGCVILGGHSIEDSEPKYGLAVSGRVHPERIWRNGGALAGDVLILTKPIGSGVLSTAMKRGLCSDEATAAAISTMKALNKAAAECLLREPEGTVSACTDVTGFGLIGHLLEMVRASDAVQCRLSASAVPLLPETEQWAASGVVPGGTQNNMLYTEKDTLYSPLVGQTTRVCLNDAQTSGGLMVALRRDRADAACASLTREGVFFARIGDFVAMAPAPSDKAAVAARSESRLVEVLP